MNKLGRANWARVVWMLSGGLYGRAYTTPHHHGHGPWCDHLEETA